MLINVKKNDYKVRIVSKYGALQIRDLSVSTHAHQFAIQCKAKIVMVEDNSNYP